MQKEAKANMNYILVSYLTAENGYSIMTTQSQDNG